MIEHPAAGLTLEKIRDLRAQFETTILFFYLPSGCSPCDRLKPLLATMAETRQLAQKEDVCLVWIDATQHAELCQWAKAGHMLRRYPSLLRFDRAAKRETSLLPDDLYDGYDPAAFELFWDAI
jgi:hypothetical protein